VAGGIERGEVRLFRFPSPDKPRPVLVLTRSEAIRYLSRVTIAPITSTLRGVPSEIPLGIEDGMKQACAVNLHNLITVPKDAVGPVVARLSEERMRQVCGAIGFALGCD